MAELIGPARLILAGSTLAGEEEAILSAWPAVLSEAPGGVLMIAPRHKERFGVVSELLANGKYPYFRCSEIFRLKDSESDMTLSVKGAVFLLDTIGDLASMYSKAAVAFVGGSLVPRGGHNPLEAAQFAVPVVMGPSYENFREMVEMMRAKDAIRLTTTTELADALAEMLGEKGRALGERGREVFEGQAGATRRTVTALLDLLPERVQ
jgi:3-deoxy-D-manno-octulosonic-acid transferase